VALDQSAASGLEAGSRIDQGVGVAEAGVARVMFRPVAMITTAMNTTRKRLAKAKA